MACGSAEVVGQTATMGSSGGVQNLPQHPQEQMQSKPLGASTVLSLTAQGSYPPHWIIRPFKRFWEPGWVLCIATKIFGNYDC